MIAWRIFAMVHLAMHDALNGIAPDEIGYAHAANFTIAFTKAFGISPLNIVPAGVMLIELPCNSQIRPSPL
jgi:hypothetical protein